MKNLISTLFLIFFIFSLLYQSAIYSQTPKHSFDVLNYQLYFDIYDCFKTPFPRSFTANNKITFKVDSTLNSINLNAVNTSLIIDSVRLINGPLLSFNHTNNILSISLDRTYNPGETVNIIIYYRHNNVIDHAFYVSNGMVFTDNPPEGARKWFPCWDKPSDKATTDLTAKVPSNVRLGSNGRLADSVVTGDTIYYHWISRDPVATYLVVMTGRVNYNIDIKYWQKPSNPNDSIPTRFYFSTGENYLTIKNIINTMLTYFSEKFGEYPFEKAGFATAASGSGFQWAGMENQTLITLCYNCWTENLAVHEFSHMWFGDMITCGTWSDIWLNEGFATFMEAFWKERTGGYTAYKNDINSKAVSYFSQNAGFPIYVPAWQNYTPSIDSLYHYGIIYCKGACVLHLLRYHLGDSIFFAALNSYATDTANFKYKNATTDEFKDRCSQVSGQNLDWFFNAWVKQPNHPVYQNSYTITDLGGGNWKLDFLIKQVQTNAGFFPAKFQIKVVFNSGPDSTVTVFNNVNNQMFTFYFDRQPTNALFDPNNYVVLKSASTIGVKEISTTAPDKYELQQNYPNPFNSSTNIKFSIPEKTFVKIKVFDLLGREVAAVVNEELTSGVYSINWNVTTNSKTELSSGIYYCRMETQKFSDVKRIVLIK